MINIKKQGFSNEWEKLYKKNIHSPTWPWSDIVSYINIYCKKTLDFKKVLEIGCGSGANIPFFQKRGHYFYGIDGSKVIIKKLKIRYPKLKNNLVACDFTKEIKFDKIFDVVIDRGSSIHNTSINIDKCIKLLVKKLRKNGIYIGVDLFASDHTSAKLGKYVDKFTRKNINTNQFKGAGKVHFFTKKDLIRLFVTNGFEILTLEHIKKKILIGKEKINNCTFNIVAKKL